MILLDRVTDLDALEAVIDKCRQSVSMISTPAGTPVSISVGGILAEPHEDAGTLIDRADRAMMIDKQRARTERGVRTRGTGAPWSSVPPQGTTVDDAGQSTGTGPSVADGESGAG